VGATHLHGSLLLRV